MGWRFAKTLTEEILPLSALEDSDLWGEKEEREMHARIYVLPELQPILVKANVRWKYINYGYLFKFAGSYKLGWWPRTGALSWQGYSPGEDYFLPQDRGVVSRVQDFLAIPTAGKLYPDEFPEKKRSRRKPSKSEMIRHVEERRNERRAGDLSARSPRANPQLNLHTQAEVRVPGRGKDPRHGTGDKESKNTSGGEAHSEKDPVNRE